MAILGAGTIVALLITKRFDGGTMKYKYIFLSFLATLFTSQLSFAQVAPTQQATAKCVIGATNVAPPPIEDNKTLALWLKAIEVDSFNLQESDITKLKMACNRIGVYYSKHAPKIKLIDIGLFDSSGKMIYFKNLR